MQSQTLYKASAVELYRITTLVIVFFAILVCQIIITLPRNAWFQCFLTSSAN